ncbi:wax ester/triacylglycerol synthase domain-containing protein [Nocardia tengchongensis]|uniref:wax ester/triacylglycerol synthase domain-containing protein n=1 Tax=Nocardia tengchongensis TaxID=2055889 RepID=UPI0033DB312D
MWLESPETPMHVAALAVFESESEPAAAVAKRIVDTFRDRTDIEARFRSLRGRCRGPRLHVWRGKCPYGHDGAVTSAERRQSRRLCPPRLDAFARRSGPQHFRR